MTVSHRDFAFSTCISACSHCSPCRVTFLDPQHNFWIMHEGYNSELKLRILQARKLAFTFSSGIRPHLLNQKEGIVRTEWQQRVLSKKRGIQSRFFAWTTSNFIIWDSTWQSSKYSYPSENIWAIVEPRHNIPQCCGERPQWCLDGWKCPERRRLILWTPDWGKKPKRVPKRIFFLAKLLIGMSQDHYINGLGYQ